MNAETQGILDAARRVGWVMEPVAKELFRKHGLPVTRFRWVQRREDLLTAAREVRYPLVAKIVSPEVVHKSDVGGVEVGIRDEGTLEAVYTRMEGLPAFEGILLDEMVPGVEMIVGSKEDPQFGTVVVVGIGGTSVEIYKDVAIRMAPVSLEDALDAIDSLKGGRLLQGYRGGEPVNREALATLLVGFSRMAYGLRDAVESIDLNPVLCGAERSVIADARIMLKG